MSRGTDDHEQKGTETQECSAGESGYNDHIMAERMQEAELEARVRQ